MMYSASRADVKKVIQWLRSDDESQWEDQTSLLYNTISELDRMARPLRRPDETGSGSVDSSVFSSEAIVIGAAIPELRKMLQAMHSRNRHVAIESGEAALALLPEGP